MAYNKVGTHGSWFQEQTSLINTASATELNKLNDKFDERLEDVTNQISANHKGLNIFRDAKRMLENKEVMLEYKQLLLDPILDELRGYDCSEDSEKVHMEQVADQLEEAWDTAQAAFIQESYNVSSYLPLSTLDFPALVKQYIRFLGKELIPVQTASSVNIEQRIFTKFLVNNQTGEEYEVPRIYWQKEADGTPTWRKLWNAGKGIRLREKVLTLATIQAAPNKKYSIYNWLMADDGSDTTITPTVRTRLSYDFNIKYVQLTATAPSDVYAVLTAQPADWATAYASYYKKDTDGSWIASDNTFVSGAVYEKTVTKGASTSFKVRLPGAGIGVAIELGGVFINGGITEDMNLPAVDPATNKVLVGDDGKAVMITNISDRLSGQVDFVKGTVQASSCGVITGIYVSGHVSNETNMRTIGFREYPEIRKYKIADGCRFQLPFTVEDFAEANASLNFNLYNRLVQELVTNQEMFEDQSILEFLDMEFDEYDGYDSDVWNLESYTHTEYADLDPTSISTSFAGDPYEYRTNAIHNALASLIYELSDRGKLENLGFVIYCNPKCARLIKKFVTWTTTKATTIGGVQMNHSFGVLTDESTPIRVVASNRVDAFTVIPAYQDNTDPETDLSREYFYKIVAYPMDNFHISYKHLRFARHLTNSPENAAYADAQNPGGAAVLVTTSSQYETIKVQGIQGRVICKNTSLVPDAKAGVVK